MIAHVRRTAIGLMFGLAIGWALGSISKTRADGPPALSDGDRAVLERLADELLCDPRGAERVVVRSTVRDPNPHQETYGSACWLRRDATGKRELYFVDRRAEPAPPESSVKQVDFVAACRERYSVFDEGRSEEERQDRFGTLHLFTPDISNSDVANAAWLHRLGHDDLAARALAAARLYYYKDFAAELRADLAWFDFDAFTQAYLERADDEAVAHGKHLLGTYPGEAAEYPQVEVILADLARRRAKGTFGKKPAAGPPAEFAAWDVAGKTKYLLDDLDEVEVNPFSYDPSADLEAYDRRVAALIEIGEPAIPALLDALDDDRLTRSSAMFNHHFPRHHFVVEVRQAVLLAITAILRAEFWETRSKGRPFDPQRWDDWEQAKRQVRAYWAEYGKLPPDERMMRILVDPRATYPAKQEAACNLADARYSWGMDFFVPRRTTKQPNPVVAKFTNPTVAEAILAAYDAERAALAADPKLENGEWTDEEAYLAALKQLGDKRVADDCARRSIGGATPAARLRWAFIALQLGDSQPLDRLAEVVRLGTYALPGPVQSDFESERYVELSELIQAFAVARTAATEQALAALVEPTNPYYDTVAEIVDAYTGTYVDDEIGTLVHPFCLPPLRRALDDKGPADGVYSVKDDALSYVEAAGGGFRGQSLPPELADPQVRRDRVEIRRCDVAAVHLGEMVVGLPYFHPLLLDADRRLAQLRSVFDRFGKRYRDATRAEADVFGEVSWEANILPDIRPLGRAATPADVREGTAIFQLDGRGKPAELKLPAVAELNETDDEGRPKYGLILQAEVDADGRTVYGVVERHAIRTLRDGDFRAVRTEAEFAAAHKAEELRRRASYRGGGMF